MPAAGFICSEGLEKAKAVACGVRRKTGRGIATGGFRSKRIAGKGMYGARIQAVMPESMPALPSNMGMYRDSAFSLLPELDLKARWMLTDRLSLNVGYRLLFLTNVYRTGQQINRRIDADQLPVELPVNDHVQRKNSANGSPHHRPSSR